MKAFLIQVVKNYRTTGAVMPSSRALARAMTAPLRRAAGRRRVLEVGPGTGAFTRHILEALRDGDSFHLVEINPEFARQLERTVLGPFRSGHPGIEVVLHVAPVEEAPIEGRFDFIVCGLPFNNFPLSVVSLIFRRMMSLLKEDGELTYFEYLGMKAVKWPWVGAHGRVRLRRRAAMGKVLERRYRGRRDLILRNLTPAHAIHLQSRLTGRADRDRL